MSVNNQPHVGSNPARSSVATLKTSASDWLHHDATIADAELSAAELAGEIDFEDDVSVDAPEVQAALQAAMQKGAGSVTGRPEGLTST